MNEYCSMCYKPTKYQICGQCLYKIKHRGHASKPITSTEILTYAIDYQQLLSHKIFNYSVSTKYRVPKEQRKGKTLSRKTVSNAVSKLTSLLSIEHKYGKTFHLTYSVVSNQQLNKTIIYYTLLWFIAKHILNYKFETEDQFKYGLCSHIIHYTRRYYAKTQGKASSINRKTIYRIKLSFYDHLYNILQQSVSECMVELMREVKKL